MEVHEGSTDFQQEMAARQIHDRMEFHKGSTDFHFVRQDPEAEKAAKEAEEQEKEAEERAGADRT